MIFKLGELFCGPGGIAWGATHADIGNSDYKIIHQWANDYDASTCETYRHNICRNEPQTVYHEDIRKFDMSKLAPIDALAFGFPCNDYSVVGEQKGMDGVYGPLYSYGVKALKMFKPQWFLAENVGGLRNANEGKAFTKILTELRNAGYTITPHLYKFEEYGVPQARHRIIIVGIRNDIDVTFHVPSTEPYKDIDNSCRKAIEEPPIPQDALNNERTRQSDVVVRRLQHILPGQNAFTADLPEELQLNIKGAKISQIYKRLDPTKPSYTVTGSGGGGTHIYHWEEPRALTNRERARLQTFPDAFLISKASRYDIKGRKYIGANLKYYFTDLGLRNARLNFRQQEPTHIMENIVYNELLIRGYNVDVGVVDIFDKDKEGKRVRKQLEVDFVVNQGNQRYYIQVAYDMTSEEKQTQEFNSLRNIPDSFKKIVIVNGSKKPWRNDEGFVIMGMKYFLLNANSLEF